MEDFGISQLVELVKSRRLRATDVTSAALERIHRSAELNAVISLNERDSMYAAEVLDHLISAGGPIGPLAGMPVLIKDIEHAAGFPTTFGSALHAGAPAEARDGLMAQRLRSAGAIVVGKTNVPEFATEGFTDNLVYGPTRNPWRLDRSPGGSSGGSAAAIAAGLVPIVTATDLGGSTRVPASLCGLIGLKPSLGLIGRDPILPSIDLNQHAPMATSTADLRLILTAVSGGTPGDFLTPAVATASTRRSVSRIMWAPGFAPGVTMSPSVERAFATGLRVLSEAIGSDAHQLEGSVLTSDPAEAHLTIISADQAWLFGVERIDSVASALHPSFVSLLSRGRQVTLADYQAARASRRELTEYLDTLLGNDGVIATPNVTIEGWAPDGRTVEGERADLTGGIWNTEVQNLTGHPAITIPMPPFESGMPFGIQLTGPRQSDAMLLDIASLVESYAAWPKVAPGYEPFGSAFA